MLYNQGEHGIGWIMSISVSPSLAIANILPVFGIPAFHKVGLSVSLIKYRIAYNLEDPYTCILF